MPRFSPEAKAIYDVLTYETDYDKAMQMLKKIDNPLDIAFVKIWIAFNRLIAMKYNEFLKILKEIEEINQNLKDEFIEFFVDSIYCWYYAGYGQRIVNKEKVEEYFEKIEKTYDKINFVDDWEKYSILARYYYTKMQYRFALTHDTYESIEYTKKWMEASSRIPIDGHYAKMAYGQFHLASRYIDIGQFDRAELLLQEAISFTSQYENNIQFYPIVNLAFLYTLKGDLDKALGLHKDCLNIARRSNNLLQISAAMINIASNRLSKGDYETALQYQKKSLKIKIQHGDPMVICNGYLNLLNHYMIRYDLEKDPMLIEYAKKIFENIEELKNSYPEDATICYIRDISKAEILQHGNMRDKVKAMDILEELERRDEFYNPTLWMTLLALYFEDYLFSEDKEVENKIDSIIIKLENVQIISDPKVITNYFYYQILISKFYFNVKKDPNNALEVLTSTQNIIEKYDLPSINTMISNEISDIQQEISKWDNVSYTLKERIKESKINDYIQLALNVAKQQ